MPKAIVLTRECDTLHEKALELAEKLRLPALGQAAIATADMSQVIALSLGEGGLSLRCLIGEKQGGGRMKPVRVDFTGGKNAFRLAENRTIHQPLARAVGIGHGRRPSIFDATAGLGGDAFVLAALGCRVTMAERSEVVAALLADGLARAAAHPETAPIIAGMRLITGDARTILPSLTPPPDCVYLDPMYPHPKKSALRRKEMRILRQVVGDDDDSADLLTVARATATERVVVKRPKGASWLATQKPSHAIAMPNSRFDVYLRLHL
ncbi:MAG: class I SAM-dependent methyltransferase [Desulfobulbaceae bacterium]|nr:class I SAM-dependent methyltransferase [Desulfobulbaceae bacterium]